MSDQWCKHCGCGADIHQVNDDGTPGVCNDNRICPPCRMSWHDTFTGFHYDEGMRYCGCTDRLSHSHKANRGIQCPGFELFVADTERGGNGANAPVTDNMISRSAAPLCIRCHAPIPHKSDCFTREQQREENRDNFDY
jgi:hypothetical protein